MIFAGESNLCKSRARLHAVAQVLILVTLSSISGSSFGQTKISISPIDRQVGSAIQISHDGQSAIYSARLSGSDYYDVFVTNIADGNSSAAGLQLANHYAKIFQSTSGDKVAIYCQEVGKSNFGLYSLSLTDLTVSQVTPDESKISSAKTTLSPDNQWLVFLAEYEADGQQDLYSAPINGGDIVRLNSLEDDFYNQDIWFKISENSETVVFSSNQATEWQQLYSVPITGGEPTRLTSTLTGNHDVEEFTIHPDGDVVYAKIRDKDSMLNRLYAVSVDGSNLTAISGGWSVLETEFNFERDLLVYRKGNFGNGWTGEHCLFKVDLNTNVEQKIEAAKHSYYDNFKFKLSPKSSYVVFTKKADDVDNLYGIELSDQERLIRLTEHKTKNSLIGNFSIAADNARVVYLSNQEGGDHMKLYSVSTNGGFVIKLSDKEVPESFVLSKDGGTVVYASDYRISPGRQIYANSVIGGSTLKLSGESTNGGDVSAYVNHASTSRQASVIYRADLETLNLEELFKHNIEFSPKFKTSIDDTEGFNVFFGTVGTATPAQSVRIEGRALESSVLITATQGFEVSLDSLEFSSQLSLTTENGDLKETILYVRADRDLSVGEYNGSLSVNSESVQLSEFELFALIGLTPELVVDANIEVFEAIEGAHSLSQSFQLDGNDLVSPISIQASHGFELSIGPGQFHEHVEVLPTDKNFSGNIKLRVAATAKSGTIDGNIILQAQGATDVMIPVEAIVSDPPILEVANSLDLFRTLTGEASGAQILRLSGQNLDDIVTIDIHDSFEVSNDGVAYNESMTIPTDGGQMSEQNIYVRLKAQDQTGKFEGNIVFQSNVATVVIRAVFGEVLQPSFANPSDADRLIGTSGFQGGSIFEINLDDPERSHVIHEMRYPDQPYGLVAVSDVLYGRSSLGGVFGYGTLFQIDADGQNYRKLHDFQLTDGRSEENGLLVSDGKLWGLCPGLSSIENGKLFSVDLAGNEFKIEHDFNESEGGQPIGTLVADSVFLFGCTQDLYSNGQGSIFRFNTRSGELTVLHSFQEPSSTPISGLVKSNGRLWGLSDKVVFVINLDGSDYKVVHEFNEASGLSPVSALTVVENTIMGVCKKGGANGQGVIFRFGWNVGDYEPLHSFGSEDQANPGGRLVFWNNRIWGACTINGGDNRTLYSVDTSGKNFKLETAQVTSLSANMAAGNGLFFFANVTSNQTTSDRLMRFNDESTEFHTIYEFQNANLHSPVSALSTAAGSIFASTSGYAYDSAIGVFSISLDGTGMKSHLTRKLLGQGFRLNELVKVGGNFFGSAYSGALNHKGILFSMDTSGSNYVVLHEFSGDDGTTPSGELLWDDHKLIGVTSLGGSENLGVVYQINEDGTEFKNLLHFGSNASGLGRPIFGITKAFGRYWGTTTKGGAKYNGYGAIYSCLPDGTDLTIHHIFDRTDSFQWVKTKLLEYDGKLWGYGAGANHAGLIQLNNDGTGFQIVQEFYDSYQNDYAALVVLNNQIWGVCGNIDVDGRRNPVFTYDTRDGYRAQVEVSPILGSKGPYFLSVIESNQRPFSARIPDIMVEEDHEMITIDLDDYFYDYEDGNNLKYEIVSISSDEKISSANIFSSQLRIQPRSNAFGNITFVISGEDSGSKYHHEVFEVLISPSPDVPDITDAESIYGSFNESGLDIRLNSDDGDEVSHIYFDEIIDGRLYFPDGVREIKKGEYHPVIALDNALKFYANQAGNGAVIIQACIGADNEAIKSNKSQANVQISKANLTVTALNKSKVYGDDNPEFSYSIDGFVNDDNLKDLDLLPTASTTADRFTDVGQYAISVDNGFDDNYIFTYYDATLDILSAPLTVQIKNDTITYGDEIPAISYEVHGFVNGEGLDVFTENPSFTTIPQIVTNAGVYQIEGKDGSALNYELNFLEGHLLVRQRELTVKVKDAAMFYGDELPAFEHEFNGFVKGDDQLVLDEPILLASNASSSSQVGTYQIWMEAGADNNYSLLSDTGNLIIKKAQLTVSVKNYTRSYGTENPTFVIDFDGFKLGEGSDDLLVQPIASTSAEVKSDAGEYEITISAGLSENYAFEYSPGVLNISRAVLVTSVEGAVKEYGNNNPEFVVQYKGFKNGDDLEVIDVLPMVETEVDEFTSVGMYDLIASGGFDNNYDFSYIKGGIEIVKSSLVVGVADITIGHLEKLPTPQLYFEGFKLDDDRLELDELPKVELDTGDILQPGDYLLNLKGGNDNNYEFELHSGRLTVVLTLAINSSKILKVYPNPFSEYLVLEGIKSGYIQIYDLSGRIIHTCGVSDRVNLEHLRPGMYVLKYFAVKGQKATLEQRVIKN